MAIDVPLQALSAPAASEAAPTSAAPGEDVISAVTNHPIFQQVLSGEVPAVYAQPQLFGDRAQIVLPAIAAAAKKAGLGYTDTPKTQSFVVYNPQKVTAEQVDKADEAGQLDSIAVSIIDGSAGSQQGAAPAGDEQAAPAAAPAPSPIAGLFPAGSEDDLTAQRLKNVTPKPPTKQASPAGGVLNSLFARAT